MIVQARLSSLKLRSSGHCFYSASIMRDILVTVLILGSLPFILRRPYIGILVWAWVSYMNPHRLTWGFAYDLPFAQIVAITLFASLIFNKEKMSVPVDGLMFIWLAFIGWMGVTSIFAINELWAMPEYIDVVKIQILTFITVMLMNDKRRVDLLVWAIALSIGFYSIKGGIFTLLSGGAGRVYGPMQSFIRENNALALATLVMTPFLFYLHHIAPKIWVKHGLKAAIFFSLLSAVGSQSRGALVAMLAVGAYFWWQSKSKAISLVAIVLLGSLAFAFMPAKWHERMGTIQNYQEDPSAMARINAWNYSLNVANRRFTGAGFNSFNKTNFARYGVQVDKAFVAHSIYFGVLADHGWIGLGMFMSILALTWRNLTRVIRRTNGVPELTDANFLARMLKVSLIAFMAGGAFLSLSYFDLPWHIVAIAFLLTKQLDSGLWSNKCTSDDNQYRANDALPVGTRLTAI